MKKKKSGAKSPAKRVTTSDSKLEKEFLKVGERIKQLRIEKGYTSYEIFAFESGINRTQFGRYERGEDLRYSSLLKVCDALGVTIKEFFSEGFE
jgi:transcriptional regulator with XRE-family HTH domain